MGDMWDAFDPKKAYYQGREAQKQEDIDDFLEDLYGHRGKNELELVHYLVELENKWKAKKNGK